MNKEKKLKRYTQIGDLLINLTNYRRALIPRNECLEWTGARHRQGYGMIAVLSADDLVRKMTVVHRISMRIKLNRTIAATEAVRHSCNNNLCCNPEHLYIKNVKEKGHAKRSTKKV